MPANIVKPGQEQYWERAKAQAAKQGHAEDWPYIVSIFKQMTVNKAQLPVLIVDRDPRQLSKATAHTGDAIAVSRNAALRTPGQVPNRRPPTRHFLSADEMEANRLASAQPHENPAAIAAREEAPRLTVESIVTGLGLSHEDETQWTRFLRSQIVGGSEELAVRSAFMSRARETHLDADKRLVMYRRLLQHLKDRGGLNKARVLEVWEPGELLKAEARGGKYHARIPKQGGGYRYIYDGEEYAKREDAHLHGPQVAKRAAHKAAHEAVTAAGKKGAGPDDLKHLAKKHGARVVAQALAQHHEEGTLSHEKGRFYAGKGGGAGGVGARSGQVGAGANGGRGAASVGKGAGRGADRGGRGGQQSGAAQRRAGAGNSQRPATGGSKAAGGTVAPRAAQARDPRSVVRGKRSREQAAGTIEKMEGTQRPARGRKSVVDTDPANGGATRAAKRAGRRR